MNKVNRIGYVNIFVFWFPLALTWLMMAMEGPFLAAIVARLPDPKANLAAHGIAFALAILIEAPVIMIMSASTALAKDRDSFIKLRNFTYALNLAVTLVMVLLLFTPAMGFITRTLIGLPEEVARLVGNALIILLPWPGAIGYRRFFQGILIRGGLTRRVAYGTVVRVTTMGATGFCLYLFADLPGAYVGAAALSAGVFLEAIAARIMALGITRRLLAGQDRGAAAALTYRQIMRFYFPLALTSTISLAIHPLVAFFVGQSRFALESLAVLPVINGLAFLFRALGLSYLEVTIALMGDEKEHYRELRNFAGLLASFACGVFGLIAFTPLSKVWFEGISGLTPALSSFARVPTMILVAFPICSVLLSLQRGILVKSQRTPPITWATFIEVGVVILGLFLTIHPLSMVGAKAAALALLSGRVAGNLYLIRPCRIALRSG